MDEEIGHKVREILRSVVELKVTGAKLEERNSSYQFYYTIRISSILCNTSYLLFPIDLFSQLL